LEGRARKEPQRRGKLIKTVGKGMRGKKQISADGKKELSKVVAVALEKGKLKRGDKG